MCQDCVYYIKIMSMDRGDFGLKMFSFYYIRCFFFSQERKCFTAEKEPYMKNNIEKEDVVRLMRAASLTGALLLGLLLLPLF